MTDRYCIRSVRGPRGAPRRRRSRSDGRGTPPTARSRSATRSTSLDLVGAAQRAAQGRAGELRGAAARSTTSARRASASTPTRSSSTASAAARAATSSPSCRRRRASTSSAALEYLADRYGVELELEDEDPAAARSVSSRRRGCPSCCDRTASFYVRNLWESREAARPGSTSPRAGWTRRCCASSVSGYAPRKWDAVLSPVPPRRVLRAGAAGGRARHPVAEGRRARTTASAGRIMFPLCDRRGRVMGFGARALRGRQEAEVPELQRRPGLPQGQNVYASDIARVHATKAGQVDPREGYTDVIALHQAGLRNTVGLMGTSLTVDQVAELARLAPVVVLALDADSAGQEAMLRAAQVAAGRKLQLRVVPLPAGHGPGGPRAGARARTRSRELVAASVPFVTFRVERVLAPRTWRRRGQGPRIDELRPVFADLPPSALREELMRKVADATQLAPSLVSGWLAGPRRTPPPGTPNGNGGGGGGGPTGVGVGQKREGRRWQPPGPPRPPSEPNPTAPRPARERPGPARPPGAPVPRRVRRHARGRRGLPRRGRGGAGALHAAEPARAHAPADPPDAPARDLDDDPELAAFMAEVVNRATHLRSKAILEAEALKLRKARLDRRIADIRASGTGGDIASLAAERSAVQDSSTGWSSRPWRPSWSEPRRGHPRPAGASATLPPTRATPDGPSPDPG